MSDLTRQQLCAALRSALAAPQPEPEKRIVWCTETDSACSTCPTLRIPCQAATQAAALNARVTVPREPTQEMIAAGEAVFRSYCFRHVNGAIPTYEAMIAAVPAPAAPPPIDNRFVAPGCEQFGTRADAESLLTMLRATLDEYMRLAAAPAVPRPDEFTCPYCFDQGAAPAVPLTDEQQIAIREAHCNTASDEYFGARPQVDDATKRRTYEAGFKEGWESGIGGGGNG